MKDERGSVTNDRSEGLIALSDVSCIIILNVTQHPQISVWRRTTKRGTLTRRAHMT